MRNIVKITLWDKTVGYIKWDDASWKNTGSIFQFDKEFVRSGLDISPILMPVKSQLVQKNIPQHFNNPKDTFRGLPPVFAQSLPDHWGTSIFNAWAKKNLTGKTTPVDMLSFIGTRGMGALEYHPSIIKGDNEAFDVDVNRLYDFAKQILAERTDPEFNADEELLWQDLIKLGTSPGGKRPKALIAINKNSGSVKSGQAELPPGYEHFILKYDNETDTFQYAKVEYAYYLLCQKCGIKMTETALRRFDTATHFITKRFDRLSNKKIHMQSLRAMTGGCRSYEDALAVTKKLNLNYSDTEQLYRMMVFNVLSGNIDDHDNNFSFLMDETGTWRLSPAYDMIYSIDPSLSDFQKGQFMSVNGKVSEISADDMLKVARTFDIKSPERIIENTLDSISCLPKILSGLDVIPKVTGMITNELNKKHKSLGAKYSQTVPEIKTSADDIMSKVSTEFERKTIIKIKDKFPEKEVKFLAIKKLLTKGKHSGTLFKIEVDKKKKTFVSDNQTKDISYTNGHYNLGEFHEAQTWKTINGKQAAYTPTRVMSLENKKKFGIN